MRNEPGSSIADRATAKTTLMKSLLQTTESGGWKRWLSAMGVLLVALAVYANTLWNGFVYDDLQNIVQNYWIKNPVSVAEMFGSHMGGFNPEFATSYYRPLIHVAHLLVYHLAGLSPAAFHLLNALLHAVNSVLAFLIAQKLIGGPRFARHQESLWALAVGLLFATHPVHSESVAWISGISDLSYTAFALSAFLLYIRGEESGTIRYWVAGALFFAAALCKEPALVLLPLIVVYEARLRENSLPKVPSVYARRWLPFAVATALYFVLRVHALGGLAPSRRAYSYEPLVYILSALDLLAQYMGKLMLPVSLKALHVFRPVESVFDVRALVGLAVGVGLVAAAWCLRRYPLAAVGFGFLLLPLLPALYIPAIGEGAFFERYLYFPVLGFAILAILGAGAMIERWPQATAGVTAFLILLVSTYATGTVIRNRVWRDNLSLWSDTVRKLPDSAVAQEYLCFARYEARELQDALRSCRRALELDEGRIDARTNLATTLSVLGDLDGAIREFQEVLRRRPNAAGALTNLGLVYMAKGRTDLAIETYRRALRANPYYAEAHNNLGVALALTGRREEAITELSAAVRLAPDSREYVSNLAAAKAGEVATPTREQTPALRPPTS